MKKVLLYPQAKTSAKNQSKLSLAEHPKTKRKVYFFSFLSIVSGVIAVFFLSLHLAGVADADSVVKKAFDQGNLLYESGEYGDALSLYEECLISTPENKDLCFNAAQAAYMLDEYEKAIEYYGQSTESIERFINLGNAGSRLGDAAQDVNQKMQYYSQALEDYLEGIKKYPQDLTLKYNYEALLSKIEEQQSEQEQESDSQSGDESDEQESQEQEEQEQSDSEEGENQEQGESEEEENQEQESQEENTEESQEAQEQSSGEDENSEQDQSDGQDTEGEEQEAYSQEDQESEQDQEAIERILKMLEGQEEESLKNNQSVVGGKEGKYDW